uniref:Uncharacterized protein n=2 Tax=unclassified Caudoviricetes TaxID=2788787 RepID=A0A8S5LTP1_9CAUD|nr:MAG TPA: hypothetical protein [Siphoviridae sp. ctKm44]DAE09887.1 MAG TPA: hypothetical protein [Siphoviridae sp. ctJdE31]DAU98234.1 MAG TPA: hypothetical protein [Caudoviricetes sp.]DAX93051.1 MAG TPA: hypothetical protein [Caudoviricetes sp.]
MTRSKGDYENLYQTVKYEKIKMIKSYVRRNYQ